MKPQKKSGRSSRKSAVGEIEIEVKVRIADRAALRRRLNRLRARQQGPRVHEMNTLYDTPEGALRRSGRMLRIRVETPAAGAGKGGRMAPPGATRPAVRLTYKGPVQPGVPSAAPGEDHSYKVRDEREVRVRVAGSHEAHGILDADEIAGILEGIGLRPCFRYEKYRSTFRLPGVPGVEVDLDETPIGDFLELEGKREAIDRSAKALGFGPADYITQTYGALFLEQTASGSPEGGQGEAWAARSRGDMFFSKPKMNAK